MGKHSCCFHKSFACSRYRNGNVSGEEGLVRRIAFCEMFCRKHWTFKRQEKNINGKVFRWLELISVPLNLVWGGEL